MLSRKGFVDKRKIWKFIKGYEKLLEYETWNGKVNCSNRKCVWLGLGVELGLKCKIVEGKKIEDNVKKRFDNLWDGDDWNSVLIYKYDVGCELKNHVDRDIFENRVVLINVSVDDLFGGNVKFMYGGREEILSNGEVLEFDNQVIHGVKRVENERWSISIRKVKI